MSLTDHILEQALALAPQERSIVIRELLHSLDADAEDGVQEAWEKEIAQRIEDIERGRVELINWPTLRQKIKDIK